MTDVKRARPFVIIGTSGSTDYLKDTTGDRRYWPVSPPRNSIPPADDGFMAAMAGKWLVEADEICDGLHDEGAPAHHLCSRCFPDLQADLGEHDEEDYGAVRRDESPEME